MDVRCLVTGVLAAPSHMAALCVSLGNQRLKDSAEEMADPGAGEGPGRQPLRMVSALWIWERNPFLYLYGERSELVAWLRQTENSDVVVNGYDDALHLYRVKLPGQRKSLVLIANGRDAHQIHAAGYGESVPLATSALGLARVKDVANGLRELARGQRRQRREARLLQDRGW